MSDYAIWSLDLNGNVTSWNAGSERIMDWRAAEIMGRHSRTFFTAGDTADEVPQKHLKLALSRGRYEEECLAVRKDGSTFFGEFTVTPLIDEHHRQLGFVQVIRDLSTQKQIEAVFVLGEEALRHSERKYRDLVETSHDLIWSVDEQGCWTFLNRQATLTFYGYEPEEMLGRPFTDFLEPGRIEHEMKVFEKVKLGQSVFGFETRHVRKDGQLIDLSFNAIPMMDVQGRVVGTTGTARNNTAAVHDREAARVLEEQLRQSQKMDAFGQLAGGIAHEFNNLLTVILGNAQFIAQSLPADDPARECLAIIHEAGERGAALTRQLLSSSRKSVLEPRIVNLNDLVGTALRLLKQVLGKNIRLAAALDPATRRVRVDPALITQVLMNLAINARDAMPGGGGLTIATRNVHLDQAGETQHAEMSMGEFVMLTVADTGCGMSPEVKARIFEPFFSTKPIGQGTGLGLSVVHGIVRQSGGYIAVATEPGAGSVFRIYLPADLSRAR